MSKSTRGIRAAGVASLAVTLSIGVAAPAFAAPGFEFTRVAGDDRYATAVEAAEIYGASDDVILANGQPGEYADALAGNYLAGAEDAPILLTKRSGLPGVTKSQIDDIDPATIWVVGGEAAVPADQVAALEADGYNVERIAGDDRFGTNAKVIAADGPATDGLGLIATGLNFPDALSAGPFAYQGHSLGLVRTNSVPDVVGDALEADGVTKVLIFGGTDAVGAGVVSDLATRGITVEERFAGADRSETSELAAEWAVANLNFTDEHVGVASGYTDGFGADALAGGPVEGNEMSPMLITRNVDNPDDVLDYLENHSDTLADGHIYGGTAAISQAAEDAMEAAAGAGDSNQDFTISPTGDQSKQASTDNTTNEGRTSFTVTGLDDTKKYDLTLFPCDNVTRTSGGVVSFEDDENTDADAELEGDNKADDQGTTETGSAQIENVNNGGPTTDGITPVNGTITFTVDSEEVDCAVAVLFEDTANDNTLNLNADNQPVEDFVATGDLSWTARPATTGEYLNAEVTSTDEGNNRFGADTGGDTSEDTIFNYDGNDTFNLPGLSGASLAQFENALTVGDILDIQYNSDPDGVSTFTIDTNTTPAPTNVTATVTNSDGDSVANDVVITWTPGADTPAGTTYTVNRYSVAPNLDGSCPAPTGLNSADTGTDVTDATNTDTTAQDNDLDPGCYAYTVTATSPNSGAPAESALSNSVKVNAPAVPDSTPPALASASANDVNNGVGTTNQVRYTFDEAVSVLDATKFTVTDGTLTFTGTSATVSGNTVIVTLDGTLQDAAAAEDVTYDANVAASAVEDAAGNDNAADSTTFVY